MRHARRESGFALLIVLWTMVLLALIGTQIVAAGRGEARLADRLRAAAAATAAAEGAIHEAMFRLLLPGSGWEADALPRQADAPGWRVVVTATDLAGRVNPNQAAPELLAALLRNLGQDRDGALALAGAMVRWRAPNATTALLHAEARDYAAAGHDYRPPHAPFQSLEELGLVLGMTPALLAQLRPYLSIDAGAEPDFALAAPLVLQAVRDATGQRDLAATPAHRPTRSILIEAVSRDGEGTRAQRVAVVRLGELPDGRPWQIVRWSTTAE